MKELDKNIKRKYSISAYDPHWAERFGALRDFLASVFGEKALAIEHIGSTAVPGMSAKPVIDVLLVVKRLEEFGEEKERMVVAGYDWGDNYIAPNTIFFYKLSPSGEKVENIHVCEEGAPKAQQFLVMRDYLRASPERANEYSDLKELLRQKYPEDYPAYRAAKTPFLQALEQEAYHWEGSRSRGT